jgi:hypothetical protein
MDNLHEGVLYEVPATTDRADAAATEAQAGADTIATRLAVMAMALVLANSRPSAGAELAMLFRNEALRVRRPDLISEGLGRQLLAMLEDHARAAEQAGKSPS